MLLISAIALYAFPPANVIVDQAPVHAKASAESSVVGSLKRGDSVGVSFSVSGSNGEWCRVSYAGPPHIYGYVSCEQLDTEPSQPSRSLAPPSRIVTRVTADPAIAEALHLSGIEQAIQQLGDPSVYLAAIPKNRLTPQQLDDVRALVMQSMRPERFEEAVTASLKNTYPVDAYPQLLEILRSPLARQMTAVEAEQSRADPKALKEFVSELNQTPVNAQHLAIVRRIDQVTGTSELMVDIVGAVLEGMAAGTSQISAAQISKTASELRGQRGDALRQAGLLHLLYEYRAVPDNELTEYANLLAYPLVIKFNQAATRGLLAATRQASTDLMAAIMSRFPDKIPH